MTHDAGEGDVPIIGFIAVNSDLIKFGLQRIAIVKGIYCNLHEHGFASGP